VTPPLYLVPAGSLTGVVPGGLVTLDGAEGRHAACVRRTRSGERLDVADGQGTVAAGRVTGVGRDRVTLRVEELTQRHRPPPSLVLVQALAKGGRDELAVETATELGVDAVIPWRASRCVVVWSDVRETRSRRRWEDTVRAAAKQSRRADLPPVELPLTTAALASRVGRTVADGGLALILCEDAALPLAGLPLPEAGAVGELLVVVGPEGGITDAELAALTEAGGQAVRLGPQVLRASSAGAAALAVLSMRLGRWD
jgi:16S rRNA (uracil1498-N3)-methyltransferase